MKKPLILLISASLLVILTLAGCGARNSSTLVEGVDRDPILAITDPFAKTILDGLQQNDLALFTTDFDETMRAGFTQEKLSALSKTLGFGGAVKGMELVKVEMVEGYYRVTYKVTLEKRSLLMAVVIPKEEPYAVTGLWFN